MIKKIFVWLFLTTFLTSNSLAAGSGGDGGDSGGTSKVKSDYDKAVSFIKVAKKQEEKGKIEKAKKKISKSTKAFT